MMFNYVELAHGKDLCHALSTPPCVTLEYFFARHPLCCNEEFVYALSFPLE